MPANDRSFRSLFIAALAIVAVAEAPPAARAQDLDGRAIMEKADKHNRSKDEKNQISMTIISGRGEKRGRSLTTFFKSGEGDDDKSMIRFETPADVKGTGLLTIEQGETDEQWLYLPDLRKSKRIAGATKSQSFMGTDFSNYDMRTEDLAGHVYEKVGDEQVEGRACFIVEAKPKNDEALEATGYSKRRIFVDKERWVYNTIEFFDRQGKPLKTTTIEDWKQYEGLWRGDKVTVENVQKESKTLVTFNKREINKGLDKDTFSKRTLENP